MRRKTIAATVIGVSLMLCGAVMTNAYRTDHSSARNIFCFTGEQGMDAILSEPSWESENGLLVIPNTIIPKDPQVTNTSRMDMDELVALKLEFLYTESCPDVSKRGTLLSKTDMAYVASVYEIDYNADIFGDWVRFEQEDSADSVQHFYYRDTLRRNYPAQGDTTVPLFTRLSISPDVNNSRYSHIQAIGGFDIRITGHVIQQMSGETEFGLNSAEAACQAGLFQFDTWTVE